MPLINVCTKSVQKMKQRGSERHILFRQSWRSENLRRTEIEKSNKIGKIHILILNQKLSRNLGEPIIFLSIV